MRVWARNTRQMMLQFNGKSTLSTLTNIYFLNRSEEGHRLGFPRRGEVEFDSLVLSRQEHQHLRLVDGEENQFPLNLERIPHEHDLAQRPRARADNSRLWLAHLLLGLRREAASRSDRLPLQGHDHLD